MVTNEISKEYLSSSDHGRHINITASGTPGDLLHVATTAADEKDEVWLYAVNNANNQGTLFIEWGGNNDVVDLHTVGLPSAQGDVLITAGKVIGSGLDVRAYADSSTASVSGINLSGWVNRLKEVA